MNIMQRLEKLEAEKSKGDGVKVQDEGESRDECIKRHGYDPVAHGVVYILVNALEVLI
jgi:hypothetical protein